MDSLSSGFEWDGIESPTLSDFEHAVEKQNVQDIQKVLQQNFGLQEIFFQCIEDKDWISENPKLASKLAVVLSDRLNEYADEVRYITPLLNAGIVPDQQGLRRYADLACKIDNVDLLKALVQTGLNLSQRNSTGDTVLHTAIRNGAAGICAAIGEEQADNDWLFQFTSLLQDPIVLAVEVGEYAIASNLLQTLIDSSDDIFFNFDMEPYEKEQTEQPLAFEGELFFDVQSEETVSEDEVFYDSMSEQELAKEFAYNEFVKLLGTVEDSPFDGTLKFGWFSDVFSDNLQKVVEGALDAGGELHKIPDGQDIAPLMQLRPNFVHYYKKSQQELIEVAPGTFEHILTVALKDFDLKDNLLIIKDFQEAGLTIDASLIDKVSDGGKRPVPFGMLPCIKMCHLDASSLDYIDADGQKLSKLFVAAACGDRDLVKELLEESKHSFASVSSHPLYPQLVEYAVKADNPRLGCDLLAQGDSVSYPWPEEVLGDLLSNAHPNWLENAMDFMSEDSVLKLARVLFPMQIASAAPLIIKADDKGFSHLCMELINNAKAFDLEQQPSRVKLLFAQYAENQDTEFWSNNGLIIFQACLDSQNYVLAQHCIKHDSQTKAFMLQELLTRDASAERDSLCLDWLTEHELSVMPQAVRALVPGAPGYSHEVCEALVANLNRGSRIPLLVFQLRNHSDTLAHYVDLGLNMQSIYEGKTVLLYVLLHNNGDLSPEFLRLLDTYDTGLTKELVGRKELAHRFGLKGSTTLEGSKVDLEGWSNKDSSVALFFYVRDFHARLIEDGVKSLIRTLPPKSAEVVRNLSQKEFEDALDEIEEVLGFAASNPSYQELVNRVKMDKTTALLTGFNVKESSAGHAVGFVFEKGEFVHCNKGYGCKQTGGAGVNISKINKLDGVDEALRLLTDPSKEFSEGFGRPLSNTLGLESVMHLPQSEQKVGNCSIANANSLNFAVNYLVFRRLLPDNEQIASEIARSLKNLRTSDSRLATLQSYLDIHRHPDKQKKDFEDPDRKMSIYEPDMELIQNIYDKGGAFLFPAKRQRVIRRMIDDWKR